jgi:hypothetical protein
VAKQKDALREADEGAAARSEAEARRLTKQVPTPDVPPEDVGPFPKDVAAS